MYDTASGISAASSSYRLDRLHVSLLCINLNLKRPLALYTTQFMSIYLYFDRDATAGYYLYADIDITATGSGSSLHSNFTTGNTGSMFVYNLKLIHAPTIIINTTPSVFGHLSHCHFCESVGVRHLQALTPQLASLAALPVTPPSPVGCTLDWSPRHSTSPRPDAYICNWCLNAVTLSLAPLSTIITPT